jgi:DNA recombination protein RmuC
MEMLLIAGAALLLGVVLGVLFRRRPADHLPSVHQALDALADRAERLQEAHIRSETAVSEHVRFVQDHYGSLQRTTDQIARALSGYQTRGRVGEMQLEQLLQHAGLVEGVHYLSHPTREVDDARLVPDLVIRLPQGGEIVVDAKFPFDAYWSVMHHPDPPVDAFNRHARDVLAHATHLASRAYARANPTFDYVVMFLPFESLLTSALEADGLLLEKTFEKRIVLATPTSLLALLRTVNLGHERVALAENAELIRTEGAEMLKRLGTLVEHLESLRRGIQGSVDGFNAVVGSLERQALPQARRMRDLGVVAAKPLDAPARIDAHIRAG